MRHWRAERILPQLLDGTLERQVERELRVHVSRCARCRRAKQEYTLSESLLRQLPTALLPVQYSPTSYGRLVSLSRWHEDPAIAPPDRWKAPFLTAASLLVVLMMAASVGTWSPIVGESSGMIMLSAVRADSAYLPMAWSTARQ